MKMGENECRGLYRHLWQKSVMIKSISVCVQFLFSPQAVNAVYLSNLWVSHESLHLNHISTGSFCCTNAQTLASLFKHLCIQLEIFSTRFLLTVSLCWWVFTFVLQFADEESSFWASNCQRNTGNTAAVGQFFISFSVSNTASCFWVEL